MLEGVVNYPYLLQRALFLCPEIEGGLKRSEAVLVAALDFEISDNGGAVHESKDYFILHRVQTAQLQHNEKQKEQS